MKEYILSVDESIVSQAERLAHGRPLEALMNDLLSEFVQAQQRATRYDELMDRLRPSGPLPILTREQRNER